MLAWPTVDAMLLESVARFDVVTIWVVDCIGLYRCSGLVIRVVELGKVKEPKYVIFSVVSSAARKELDTGHDVYILSKLR